MQYKTIQKYAIGVNNTATSSPPQPLTHHHSHYITTTATNSPSQPFHHHHSHYITTTATSSPPQPQRLYSPSTTLALQKGTCFEYSCLLASLLIGLGYNAYVVSGYALKEVCLVDQSFDLCPLLKEEAEVGWAWREGGRGGGGAMVGYIGLWHERA